MCEFFPDIPPKGESMGDRPHPRPGQMIVNRQFASNPWPAYLTTQVTYPRRTGHLGQGYLARARVGPKPDRAAPSRQVGWVCQIGRVGQAG